MSELCVIDMLCAVTRIRNGYYRDRLVLKGGHSVRNYVPLLDHRFSFDADFNLYTLKKHSYGEVSKIKNHLYEHASANRCSTGMEITKDDSMLYFLAIDYRRQLKKINLPLIEVPKIEICKTCRIYDAPVVSKMNTMFDLEGMGVELPEFAHVSAEEQLVHKLHVIGKPSRQRRHFDAYDAFRICNNNKIDWKKTKRLFASLAGLGKHDLKKYIQECRRLLDTIKDNDKVAQKYESILFAPSNLDVHEMIDEVQSYYG